jgi:3-hydroxyisobutyrate dehydrogenase
MSGPAPQQAIKVPRMEAGQPRVAFVGAGNMGKHMAACLIRAGYQVILYDKRAEAREEPVLAGGSWADSLHDVASHGEVVVTSLPGPPEVEDVVLGRGGILEALRSGSLLIDMTTSNPALARSIAERAAARGIGAIDAPVAGGMRGARTGTLTIMAGGKSPDFERAEPLLQAMGERIFLLGGPGAGQVAKLVNNMMTIVNALTAMEAMVVGVKAGVDPQKLIEVADAGTGASYSLNLFRYVIFQGNFEPAKFALRLATKDLRLSAELAEDLGIPVRLVSCALAAMTDAAQHGLDDKDWSSYITLIEDAAGVQVRA